MKKTKILTALALMLSFSSITIAQTATAPLKTTATLNSSCTISANGVTFGAIMSPLNSQSASGNMNVLCNTGTSYNISLAYGGIYGQGGPGDYYVPGGQAISGYTNYNRYTASGVYVSAIQVPSFYTQPQIASSLGCTYAANRCSFSSSAYLYGKMSGVAKGDTIAYSISVPGNPGQVWNAGAGSYTGTGTGETQSLPILTKIEPSQSGSPYPTADTYIDTVTATLSY